jgi:hypothetical protein
MLATIRTTVLAVAVLICAASSALAQTQSLAGKSFLLSNGRTLSFGDGTSALTFPGSWTATESGYRVKVQGAEDTDYSLEWQGNTPVKLKTENGAVSPLTQLSGSAHSRTLAGRSFILGSNEAVITFGPDGSYAYARQSRWEPSGEGVCFTAPKFGRRCVKLEWQGGVPVRMTLADGTIVTMRPSQVAAAR